MGDLVDIRTKVQGRSTEDLYTMSIGSEVRCKENHMERYGEHMDRSREWRKHMEEEWWQRKACGIM